MTEIGGAVSFKDLQEGLTLHEEVDEVTGLFRLVVMDSPDEKRQPAIVVKGGYAKPGDALTAEVDPTSNRLLGLSVATYLDSPKDAVNLDVRFMTLQDGTGYPATEVLVAKAKDLSVNITNSGLPEVNTLTLGSFDKSRIKGCCLVSIPTP